MKMPLIPRIALAASSVLSIVMIVVFPFLKRSPNGDPKAAFTIAILSVAYLAASLVFVALPLSRLRRLESLFFFGTIAVFINLVFASAYFYIGTPQHFGVPLTHLDAMYFDLTTFTTVGYGDITAKSQIARGLVSMQLVIDVIFVVGVLGIFVGRLASYVPKQIGPKEKQQSE